MPNAWLGKESSNCFWSRGALNVCRRLQPNLRQHTRGYKCKAMRPMLPRQPALRG